MEERKEESTELKLRKRKRPDDDWAAGRTKDKVEKCFLSWQWRFAFSYNKWWKFSWQMPNLCYISSPAYSHLQVITRKQNNLKWTHEETFHQSFIHANWVSIYICNLHVALFLSTGMLLSIFLYLEDLSSKGKKEEKHFSVACVMIAKWHVSSWGFVDAKFWNGWYIPHEKFYWLQLKKRSRWNWPDGASPHGRGYGYGFVDVVGEYSRNQTIIWVVGSLDHFLDSLELHDLLDGAKNLQSYQNKRLDKKTFFIFIHVFT